MFHRCLIAVGVFAMASLSVVTAGPKFDSAHELAVAMVESLPATAEACDADLEAKLGPDLEAVCARGTDSFGAFKNALANALEDPVFSTYSWLVVSKWHTAEPGWMRICYWLGASSVEAWFNKKTTEVMFVTSKTYPRCGNDVPFRPPGMGDAANSLTSSLVPTGYPVEAAKDKIDGSAALEVAHVDGKPSVMCIHHATPRGLGFEFFAIEAVHTTVDLAFVEPEDPDEHNTVLVSYSKADERPRPTHVSYH